MYKRSPMQYTDSYMVSPPRSNRYNSVFDDDSLSIDIGRSVPQYASVGGGYKETENLSDRDYFKMDDLFKKDRDDFLKQNELEDDVTHKFRESTFRVIDDLPNDVASKYGDKLTDLVNKFVQEHLKLKSKYNELLRSQTANKREKEQDVIIRKLTEKLQEYKSKCSRLEKEVSNKEVSYKEVPNKVVTPKLKDVETNENDYSLLIEELKIGMSKIELEEELRLKQDLQQKEYKLLRKQLEELQEENKRKNRLVLNRDLDQFKQDLKSEIESILRGNKPEIDSKKPEPVQSHKEPHTDDELFSKLQDLIQHELKLNNEELKKKFEILLQNKVSRDELEFLLYKSSSSRQDHIRRTVSMFDPSKFTEECKFCAKSGSKSHKESLIIEIDELNEKLKLTNLEISRLENNEELDTTEMMRLVTEKHSINSKLKEKKHELDHFILDDTSVEQPQESDNCHTINILKENAQKFGIPLMKI